MDLDRTKFERVFQERLPIEQRNAILRTLRYKLDDQITLGQVVDILTGLGWDETLGELSLADLAEMANQPFTHQSPDLRAPNLSDTQSHKSAAEFQGDKIHPAPKTVSKSSPAAKAEKLETSTPNSTPSKTQKKQAPSQEENEEFSLADFEDEPLSLERSAQLFIPILKILKQATMEQLETQTGLTRRKLRFHIGQLVKHGHVERHGMGRGTYYTLP